MFKLNLQQLILIIVITNEIIRYIPQFYVVLINSRKKIVVEFKSKARASYIFILTSVILITFFIRYGNYIWEMTQVIFAFILFFSGIFLGLYGLICLKNQYSEKLIRYEGENLVTHGIYKILRHPMRLGLFLEYSGIVLLSNYLPLFFLVLVIGVFQHLRTLDEERLLLDHFGNHVNKYFEEIPQYNLIKGIFRFIKIKLEYLKHNKRINQTAQG